MNAIIRLKYSNEYFRQRFSECFSASYVERLHSCFVILFSPIDNNITDCLQLVSEIKKEVHIVMQSDGKGFSVAGLVLGIVATVLAWFYLINIAGLVCGIAGLACSSVGRKKAISSGVSSGLGTAGLVLLIIGTVISAIGFVSCTVCVCIAYNASGGNLGSFIR